MLVTSIMKNERNEFNFNNLLQKIIMNGPQQGGKVDFKGSRSPKKFT
jgi:hypothetical protein